MDIGFVIHIKSDMDYWISCAAAGMITKNPIEAQIFDSIKSTEKGINDYFYSNTIKDTDLLFIDTVKHINHLCLKKHDIDDLIKS